MVGTSRQQPCEGTGHAAWTVSLYIHFGTPYTGWGYPHLRRAHSPHWVPLDPNKHCLRHLSAETVLLWTENVSHSYKDFHSVCHHDLIPENKALSDLLPDLFSNCANNVTRVHKHPFCSPTTLPGLPSLSTTTSFLVPSPDSWLQALENKDLYYLRTENSPYVSIKFMYLCIVRCENVWFWKLLFELLTSFI